jgi:methyl-accepting chemotaxis protein
MEPARTPLADPPPGPAAAGASAGGKPPTRKLRNYLLDTSLQLKLASHLVAVATALSLGLGWLLWNAYRETSRVVALGDPDAAETLAAALAAEDRARMLIVAVALVGVLVCLLGAAVVVTHRIAGPAFVLGRTCQRIAEGDLTPPRPLRARDLLVDLAADVARMVEGLRAREALEREVIARVLAALREGGADPQRRALAVAELEALAAEKGTRLGS